MRFRRTRGRGGDESQKALDEAHQSLRRVKSRGQEVTNLSVNLRLIREHNHFIEELTLIITGQPRRS